MLNENVACKSSVELFAIGEQMEMGIHLVICSISVHESDACHIDHIATSHIGEGIPNDVFQN